MCIHVIYIPDKSGYRAIVHLHATMLRTDSNLTIRYSSTLKTLLIHNFFAAIEALATAAWLSSGAPGIGISNP